MATTLCEIRSIPLGGSLNPVKRFAEHNTSCPFLALRVRPRGPVRTTWTISAPALRIGAIPQKAEWEALLGVAAAKKSTTKRALDVVSAVTLNWRGFCAIEEGWERPCEKAKNRRNLAPKETEKIERSTQRGL